MDIKDIYNYVLKKKVGNFIWYFTIFLAVFFFVIVGHRQDKVVATGYQNIEAIGEITKELKVEQQISFTEDDPKIIGIQFATYARSNSSKYTISIKDEKGNIIDSKLVNAQEIGDGQYFEINLENKKYDKNIKYVIEISTEDANLNNSVTVYAAKDIEIPEEQYLKINGDVTHYALNFYVKYDNYSVPYYFIIAGLIVLGASSIILLNCEIHKAVFGIIISWGIFISIFNPIFDTPDDIQHFARSSTIVNGRIFLSNDSDNYLDNTHLILREHQGEIITETELKSMPLDNTKTLDEGAVMTTTPTSFLSYVPQVFGLLIGKIFRTSILVQYILGRCMNTIVYALLAMCAIKIVPKFKVPLAVVACIPMAIFLSASYNPDALTNGIALVTIAYFLRLYFREEKSITDRELLHLGILVAILGVCKTPYTGFVALILIIPRKKLSNPKQRKIIWITMFGAGVICFAWYLYTTTLHNAYSLEHLNIIPEEQIKFVVENPLRVIKIFAKSMFINIPTYINQMFTYGWLAYMVEHTVVIVWIAFMGSVILLYPVDDCINKYVRSYIILVAGAIIIVFSLGLYMIWTPVGAGRVDGLQGRYFIPLIAVMPVVCNISPNVSINEEEKRKVDFCILFISIVFIAIAFGTIINQYY